MLPTGAPTAPVNNGDLKAMTARNGGLSLQKMSRMIVGSILACALFFVALSAFSFMQTRQGERDWKSYQANSDYNGFLNTQLLTSLGYGGLIHEFKKLCPARRRGSV
jgi:hypothetical protein